MTRKSVQVVIMFSALMIGLLIAFLFLLVARAISIQFLAISRWGELLLFLIAVVVGARGALPVLRWICAGVFPPNVSQTHVSVPHWQGRGYLTVKNHGTMLESGEMDDAQIGP